MVPFQKIYQKVKKNIEVPYREPMSHRTHLHFHMSFSLSHLAGHASIDLHMYWFQVWYKFPGHIFHHVQIRLCRSIHQGMLVHPFRGTSRAKNSR